MDSDRQVWEPGLDQGSTQTLHSERHGPQEPEDCLANVAFTPTRSSHPCPGWGKRGLVELRAAALGLLGFCCKPCPPFPGAPPEHVGPAGHRAKERYPPPPPRHTQLGPKAIGGLGAGVGQGVLLLGNSITSLSLTPTRLGVADLRRAGGTPALPRPGGQAPAVVWL